MTAEMVSESMEIITMAVDKHQTTKNYEVILSNSFDFFFPCDILINRYISGLGTDDQDNNG